MQQVKVATLSPVHPLCGDLSLDLVVDANTLEGVDYMVEWQKRFDLNRLTQPE